MSLTSKSNRNAEKFRIVFLGDMGVGKTSIIEKYTTDRFDETHNSTVGIDFNVKDVKREGNLYRLQMWDTAGQERYRSLIPTYLKNAHAVVLVYDITKSKSLENLKMWHKMFAENQEAPGIVVGNKIDLVSNRKAAKGDAEEFCKKLNLKHIQVSAKTGKKINELFDVVLETILKSQQDDFLEPNSTRQKFSHEDTQPQPKNQTKTKLKANTLSVRERLAERCCSEG